MAVFQAVKHGMPLFTYTYHTFLDQHILFTYLIFIRGFYSGKYATSMEILAI